MNFKEKLKKASEDAGISMNDLQLDQFEEFYHLLIEKNKVNIYDIPVAKITDQYMDYVSHMEEKDLDLVSEFLVMAAELLDIKARMLLPKEENEEEEESDPRAELVARLLEYKAFRIRSEELKELEQDAERILFKEPTIPREVERYEQPVDLDRLLDGFITYTSFK